MFILTLKLFSPSHFSLHSLLAHRWNKHRRLINPAFSRQIINNFLPIFNAEADVMLRKFSALATTGTQLEIYEMLKRNVLEAACRKCCDYEEQLCGNKAFNMFSLFFGSSFVYLIVK